jgi:alpha-mannosidase
VKVNSNNIIIESVKKAEDGADIVVRIYEFLNQRGMVELEFAYPLKKAYESNLLEKEKKVLRFSNSKIIFFIEPYEIKTFILDFDKQ